MPARWESTSRRWGILRWFSSQPMRKTINTDLNGTAIPGQFEFISNGRATTCDLRLAYQIDLVHKECMFLPFGGWFFNQINVRRYDSLPPFFQTANVPSPYVLADQSVVFLSKLRQKWSGPIAGASLIWQLVRPVSFDMSYGYGWLQLYQNFEEMDSSLFFLAGPTPSLNDQTIIRNGRIRGSAQGHIARFKIGMRLSSAWAFNVDGRYLYLFSHNARERAEISTNGGSFQTVQHKARAQINSASAFFELSYRY